MKSIHWETDKNKLKMAIKIMGGSGAIVLNNLNHTYKRQKIHTYKIVFNFYLEGFFLSEKLFNISMLLFASLANKNNNNNYAIRSL